jgi:hypothetical protein
MGQKNQVFALSVQYSVKFQAWPAGYVAGSTGFCGSATG